MARLKRSRGSQIPIERALPDPPLLQNLENHPSANIRAGTDPSETNLSFRGAWHRALGLYSEANDVYKELFNDAGFGNFLKIQPATLSQAYTMALMERWFSETNTLHLPFGEIGPTPFDWTMVTGVPFTGRSISLNPRFKMNRALELLGAGTDAITNGRINLNKIKPSVEEVNADPPTDKAKMIIFRRLFLYVIASCFFGNDHSVIKHGIVQFLERIAEVKHYNWGGITYAAFLAGMRRKVTKETGAFTAFWQFLPLWAFEYLDISRPERTEVDAFPRARRWKFPKGEPKKGYNHTEFVGLRCQLNYINEAQVTWQPYLAFAVHRVPSILHITLLALSRVRFWSLDTWEYYLGERCRRQLGLPCRVPFAPPVKMHGTSEDEPEDTIGVGNSADNFVKDETVDYTSWFAANSIGNISNVERCFGGVETGEMVLKDWMAKHRPDLVLLPRSEYKEISEARDAAVAKAISFEDQLVPFQSFLALTFRYYDHDYTL